jgi:hypothetical protein
LNITSIAKIDALKAEIFASQISGDFIAGLPE